MSIYDVNRIILRTLGEISDWLIWGSFKITSKNVLDITIYIISDYFIDEFIKRILEGSN